jgi:hypothetical protein
VTRGSWQCGSLPARGSERWSRVAEKTEREGREEDYKDLVGIFQKCKDSTVK